MRYVPPVLIRYRYRILVSLSLLLILEMVVVASISSAPIEYEYEWVSGWIMFLTTFAWMGMAGVVGVGAPVGVRALKRPAPILILPPAIFVILMLSPIFVLSLDELFWQAHSLLFIMVWAGIVVIFGATILDIEHRSSFKETLDMSVVFGTTSDAERSRKVFLRMGVFPLLMVAWIGMFWTYGLLVDPVFDLLDRLPGIDTVLIANLFIPLGALFIILLTSLVILPVIGRSEMFLGIPRIVVALVAFVISAVALAFVIGIGLLIAGGSGSGSDAPGVGLLLIVVMPVLWSLTFCVFGTVLIGRMRRPIRNITVAGVGMVVMDEVLLLYLHLSGIWQVN